MVTVEQSHIKGGIMNPINEFGLFMYFFIAVLFFVAIIATTKEE